MVFAVLTRTFALVPADTFVWVDAPDEVAALMGAGRIAAAKDPSTHYLMRQVLEATDMGNNCPPNLVDGVVDYVGEDIEVEIL